MAARSVSASIGRGAASATGVAGWRGVPSTCSQYLPVKTSAPWHIRHVAVAPIVVTSPPIVPAYTDIAIHHPSDHYPARPATRLAEPDSARDTKQLSRHSTCQGCQTVASLSGLHTPRRFCVPRHVSYNPGTRP